MVACVWSNMKWKNPYEERGIIKYLDILLRICWWNQRSSNESSPFKWRIKHILEGLCKASEPGSTILLHDFLSYLNNKSLGILSGMKHMATGCFLVVMIEISHTVEIEN